MASSANTFGTFLETVKALETSRQSVRPQWPEQEIVLIARLPLARDGSAPMKEVAEQSRLPLQDFLSALSEGREKGLLEIDESEEVPVMRLTKLGRSLLG